MFFKALVGLDSTECRHIIHLLLFINMYVSFALLECERVVLMVPWLVNVYHGGCPSAAQTNVSLWHSKANQRLHVDCSIVLVSIETISSS